MISASDPFCYRVLKTSLCHINSVKSLMLGYQKPCPECVCYVTDALEKHCSYTGTTYFRVFFWSKQGIWSCFFCFMGRTRKSVLWHPTLLSVGQPRFLEALAYHSVEFCENCCEVEQKSPMQSEMLLWFVSCGAEFPKMQQKVTDFAAFYNEPFKVLLCEHSWHIICDL